MIITAWLLIIDYWLHVNHPDINVQQIYGDFQDIYKALVIATRNKKLSYRKQIARQLRTNTWGHL